MKENKYILGLVSISFRQHSPIEILEATRKAGLSCIEWGSDVHAPCHDTARLKELAQLQKEYGCEDVSFEPIVAFGPNGADPHHGNDGTVGKRGESELQHC